MVERVAGDEEDLLLMYQTWFDEIENAARRRQAQSIVLVRHAEEIIEEMRKLASS